jgi:hypothetical protein
MGVARARRRARAVRKPIEAECREAEQRRQRQVEREADADQRPVVHRLTSPRRRRFQRPCACRSRRHAKRHCSGRMERRLRRDDEGFAIGGERRGAGDLHLRHAGHRRHNQIGLGEGGIKLLAESEAEYERVSRPSRSRPACRHELGMRVRRSGEHDESGSSSQNRYAAHVGPFDRRVPVLHYACRLADPSHHRFEGSGARLRNPC